MGAPPPPTPPPGVTVSQQPQTQTGLSSCRLSQDSQLGLELWTDFCFDSSDMASAWTQQKHRSSVDVGDVVSHVSL
jgi:hypothetical protein